MRTRFCNYLVNKGYSVITPSSKPSTVYDYSMRIEKVCEWELTTWTELAKNINAIVIQYDKNGCKESLGKRSHNAVICALKRFQEFLSVDAREDDANLT